MTCERNTFFETFQHLKRTCRALKCRVKAIQFFQMFLNKFKF